LEEIRRQGAILRINRTSLIVAAVIGLALAGGPLTGAEQPIVPGNVLSLTVLGHPELSKTVQVRQDGTTDYPLLYNLPVDGMTITQLRDLLMPILTRFVDQPYLFISIAEFQQIRVTVQGQVRYPGAHTVTGPIDLQGVLTVAGGPTENADLGQITIMRWNGNTRQEINVDLYSFLLGRGKPLPTIEEGDIIFLPIMSSRIMVRVMGAVNQPGTYRITSDENVADMIYMAGGPKMTGNLNNVTYITQMDEGFRSETLRLKRLLDRAQSEGIPQVKPGDVIIVREFANWQQFSWWISLIRDATMLAYSALLLRRF
jgi:polysaccharide export outer membrane protein